MRHIVDPRDLVFYSYKLITHEYLGYIILWVWLLFFLLWIFYMFFYFVYCKCTVITNTYYFHHSNLCILTLVYRTTSFILMVWTFCSAMWIWIMYCVMDPASLPGSNSHKRQRTACKTYRAWWTKCAGCDEQIEKLDKGTIIVYTGLVHYTNNIKGSTRILAATTF